VAQRDRQVLAADVERFALVALEHIGEFELIGQVFDGVAGIVDVDLVDRIGVHGIIVRPVAGWSQSQAN